MNEDELRTLRTFLNRKRDERVFLLKLGTIEAYLPEGYHSKDMDKLIRLLACERFWDQLRVEPRNEIDEIVESLLHAAC
ncbi:MAG: hypothetical protein M3178_06845 [Pseudomonadota bacterium]|nr:hypothetical protein [Pseudomonadota bacterium]